MKIRRLLCLAWLAGSVSLPASAGYLVDSSGAVVRNSYGQCWRTGSWTPAQATAECDPDLVKVPGRLVPLPGPRPEPPRMEAPKPAAAAAAAPPPPPPAAQAGSTRKKGVKKNGGGGLAALLAPAMAAAPSKQLQVAVSITEHHWATILHRGDEARQFPGFGMYTYVLFGRNPTDPELNAAIRARYDATLAAVRSQPQEEAGSPSAAAMRGATNLFCLPANQAGATPSRQTYAYPLAQQYLGDFRFLLAGDQAILPRLVSDAGPFLIATLQPLDSLVKTQNGQMRIVDHQAPLLFIDLSHTHHQVIAEMVDAFKREVIDTKMERRQRFKSLRVALIDLLKKADDQVTPIREAVAGFMPKEK